MKKVGLIVLILGILVAGFWVALKYFKKTPQPIASRPTKILEGTFADKPIYEVYGYVTKWFPYSDTLEVKLYLGKSISLKVGDVTKSYIITRDPKDRTKPTVLIKDMYTTEEWGRVFCENDVLLIGTYTNVWKNIKNYMQITPDFVNVEDRPCYHLPAK